MLRGRVGRGVFPPSQRLDVISLASSTTSEHEQTQTRWALDDLAAAMINRDHHDQAMSQRFFPTDNPEVALRWLDEMAGEEVARLTKLKNEVLQPIADTDRAEAVKRAMFDASPAGIAMTRYQGSLTRELSRGLNDLMKQRKCDNDFGDVFEEVSDEKTPVATAPEPATVVAAPVVQRNEPIPQVVVKPAVTKNGPRISLLPDNSVGFLDVSASRNETSDGGKGSKTDQKPPR